MEPLAWHRGPPCAYLQDSALKKVLPEPEALRRACVTHHVSLTWPVFLFPQVNEVPQGQELILVNISMHSGWISVKVG